MANEAVFQQLRDEVASLNGHLIGAKSLLTDARGYLIDLKALVEATRPVRVTNFPASVPVTGTFWQTTQPVSGTVSVGNFPAAVVGTTTAVSLTATGDLIAAQGAGVGIRLLAAIVGAVSAVTLSLRNGASDVIPIRLAANGGAVLPFVAGGWMTTSPNTALRVAFSGANTVTAFALWVPV